MTETLADLDQNMNIYAPASIFSARTRRRGTGAGKASAPRAAAGTLKSGAGVSLLLLVIVDRVRGDQGGAQPEAAPLSAGRRG